MRFDLTEQDGALASGDGEGPAVLKDVGVTANVYPAAKLALLPDGSGSRDGEDARGRYTETTAAFRDAERTVSAELRLRRYDGLTLAFVRAELANENGFARQRTFAPESSIAITVGELPGLEGLLAHYRHKDWWTRPFFEPDPAKLPERTQALLWRTEASYYYLLPVCGPAFRCDMAGEGGGLTVRLSPHVGGLTAIEGLVFALGGDADPYRLAEATTAAALAELPGQSLPRAAKRYPERLDRLGWCSWDAYYHEVDEAKLLAKADELKRLGLPVGWVMIDDGWLDVRDGRLRSFEADAAKFPGGLGHAVRELKIAYGIPHVGVWHTVAGYWNGVHPDGGLAKRYAGALRTTRRGELVPDPEGSRGFGFWDAWHSFLRAQGVDFVKVDSQSSVANFHEFELSVGAAAAGAHRALEASIALHFRGTVINCMGMAAENVWHRPESAVSRSSDDFVPQEKTGFGEHALQNGYNSFYHGPFYWGDWDMFWTRNHDDVRSGVLRAISGGPVYISDGLGRTDPAKLWPLIYRDGTILRCDRPANPTADCLLADPMRSGRPLKLWNTAGSAGVVAAFHLGVGEEAAEGTIGPSDVPGFGVGRYALYGRFSRTGAVLDAGESLPLKLAPGGCELYAVVPLAGAVAPVGLADKYVAPHAVLGCREEVGSVRVELREGGRFVFYAETAPATVRANGRPVQVALLGDRFYEADCGAAGDSAARVIVDISLEEESK